MKRCCTCRREKPLGEFCRAQARRDGLNPRCRRCAAEASATPQCRARHRHYYGAHRAEILAQKRGKYQREAEVLKAKAAAHRVGRRAEASQYARQYYGRNRAKWAVSNGKRRALMAKVAIGPINFDAIYSRDGGRCWICWLTVPRARANFDHVIPIARGGEHSSDNLRTACRRCNTRKHDLLPTPALIARIGEEVRRLAA